MAEISERTGVRLSFATLIGLGAAVVGAVNYQASWEEAVKAETDAAFERADAAYLLAESATDGVEELSLIVRVSNIRRDIKDLQAELRSLKRELENHPDSDLIRDQIEDVENELEELENILRCYRTAQDADRCEEHNL